METNFLGLAIANNRAAWEHKHRADQAEQDYQSWKNRALTLQSKIDDFSLRATKAESNLILQERLHRSKIADITFDLNSKNEIIKRYSAEIQKLSKTTTKQAAEIARLQAQAKSTESTHSKEMAEVRAQIAGLQAQAKAYRERMERPKSRLFSAPGSYWPDGTPTRLPNPDLEYQIAYNRSLA